MAQAWERACKNRAAFRPIGCYEAPSVRHNDTLGNRQPDARAARLAIPRRLATVERGEEARQIVWGNARPAIGDAKSDVRSIGPPTYAHFTTRRRVANRVIYEVFDRTRQQMPIAKELRWRGRRIERQ